jgi:hypothetical protein
MRVKKHFDTMKKDRHPGTHLDELVPIIASSTAELRQAAATALDGAVTWIDTVNHSRWSKPPPNAADITVRETNLAGLKETLAEYRATKHFELLDPYRQLFDEAGNVRPESHAAVRASAPTIFRCNVFTSSLISFSLMLIELLELLLSIERANPKAKIQLPSAFAKMLVKAANDTSAGGNPLDLGNGQNVDKDNSASSTDTLVAGQKEKKRKSTKAYGEHRVWAVRLGPILTHSPRSGCARPDQPIPTLWQEGRPVVERTDFARGPLCVQIRNRQHRSLGATGHSFVCVLCLPQPVSR